MSNRTEPILSAAASRLLAAEILFAAATAAAAALLAGGVLGGRRRARDPEPGRMPDAEDPAGVQHGASARTEQADAGDPDLVTAARALLDEVAASLEIDFAALALVCENGTRARGLVARADGIDLDWWRDVDLDLEHEPSGIASAAFEAAAIPIYDVRRSPRVNRRMAELSNVRSAVFVPLIDGARVVGVLTVGTTGELRSFTSVELARLQSLAREGALALRLGRVDRGERGELPVGGERRLRRQAGILAAARALTRHRSTESLVPRVVDEVAALLEADAAGYWSFDAERGVARCEAVHGLPETELGREAPLEDGLRAALAASRPVVTRDLGQGPAADFAEAVDVATTSLRGVHGVLRVFSRHPDRFDDADVQLLAAFASLASLALDNVEAYEERARQARVQQGFFTIASVLGEPLSQAATLGAVAKAASEALGGSYAAVLARAGELELVGDHGLPGALSAFLSDDFGASPGVVEEARGHLLAAPQIATDGRFDPVWQELAERVGFRSLLVIPAEATRLEPDTLVLVFFEEERRFTDDDVELAEHLARAARGALERSELFEAERTARALAQQLARTGSMLATELDPVAVVSEVVQEALALLAADASALRVLEGEELVMSAGAGDGVQALLGSRSSATAWLSGDVLQSAAPVAVTDVDDRLAAADPLLAAGYSAFLGVPLVGPEGFQHGVLAVYAREPRVWRDDEIDALQALAVNTSAALSNAELYQRVAIEKERSVAILANIADGIVAVDREGRVVLWNEAAEQITGVPGDEALGRSPQEVLQRTLQSEEGVTGNRLVPISRGDEEIWLSLSEAVMRDPAGEVAGRVFAFRDISADRLVEEMKSDFVSAVSHELRTPLTSIYGFAETLLRQDVLFGEEERRLFLGYIASESERLARIVDALLNVARLDTGDLQVTLTPTDVGAVVEEALRTVRASTPLNGHRFVVDVPSEPLAAEADREKLRQILVNLVDNAVKFSPGGGTITVTARREADAVEFEVQDEGIGIPQAEHARIFRKFYRAEGLAREEASGGTGLGLFIAEGLVGAMGGRIWVASAEGEGSRFGFELPVARPLPAGVVDSEAGGSG